MKIESKDFKIKNIFSRRKYVIPDYQRNYSWTTDEEIQIFWDDFIYNLDSADKTSFFIGPMVFKGDDINSSEFEVVDGQQRLITFSILLSVLIGLFNDNNRPDLADGLKQYLVYKDEKNEEQLVIITIEPHPFFQERIFHFNNGAIPRRDSESEQLIEAARSFFKSKIEERIQTLDIEQKIIALENIRQSIFEIDTVIIVSDDETDAFTIFETINTRGKDLSSIDLLKNYIFKNFEGKTGVEEPKETWKIITQNIKVSGETFFNRFWASWVSKVAENKLYRRFAYHVRDSEKNVEFQTTNVLLDEILAASEIYRKITQPKIDDWKENKNFHIYQHIRNINGLFNLKVHFPFFLALFEEFEDKRISLTLLSETLVLIENFHFIFTHIVSPRASGLDNKYSKFAIRLRKEENKEAVIADLKLELQDKLPSKNEFVEKFKELNYVKNKETIKFVLLKLEKIDDPSITIDLDLNSIEHLNPKSSAGNENNNVGNLFLLESKFNEIKDNYCPFDNIKELQDAPQALDYLIKNTKYKSTKREFEEIQRLGLWTNDEIIKRATTLAENVFDRLSIL